MSNSTLQSTDLFKSSLEHEKYTEGIFTPKMTRCKRHYMAQNNSTEFGRQYLIVLAKRLTQFMIATNSVDTAVQKGDIFDCVEHYSACSQITRKAWICTDNLTGLAGFSQCTYGFTPYQLISVALQH